MSFYLNKLKVIQIHEYYQVIIGGTEVMTTSWQATGAYRYT